MQSEKIDTTKDPAITSEYSGYGTFTIAKKLELKFPKTEILITRQSENHFSYYRRNSENQVTNKLIFVRGPELKVEIAPILPLNLPAKKTNDFMFLRLAQSVFVEKKSNVDILVQFPIEIGVFITSQDDASSNFFDCFTCEPMHSRFALYGTPEKGELCMYSKVSVVEKSQSESYIFALMKISLQNDLDSGTSISQFVFPVTSHEIYYKDGSSEAHIDDISCVIKQGVAKNVAEVEHVPFSRKQEDWKVAQRIESKDQSKKFVMELGFE